MKCKANVDGKLDSTRGLFVSMAGFDENDLEHFRTAPGEVATTSCWSMIGT